MTTLPARAMIVGLAAALSAHVLRAQTTDTVTRRIPPVTDSARAAPPVGPVRQPAVRRVASRMKPPLTPRRAFLYSLAVPGLGQARLDRGSSGVFFAAIEMGAIVMVRRSMVERGEVSRYRDDSVATNFTVQTDGTLKRSGVVFNRFTSELAHTRRLHVEDWIAAMAFNHLLSGADAFVAAQLWDVPKLSVYPNGKDIVVVATLRW